eukprot:scaffold10848_cov57-Phaeocystis_antarctica.AAC.7
MDACLCDECHQAGPLAESRAEARVDAGHRVEPLEPRQVSVGRRPVDPLGGGAVAPCMWSSSSTAGGPRGGMFWPFCPLDLACRAGYGAGVVRVRSACGVRAEWCGVRAERRVRRGC